MRWGLQMVTKALPAQFPFNDDEIAADPQGYRSFLAHSAIGQGERAKDRSSALLRRAKKRARRRA